MARYTDETAFWKTPRPGYMREIEPLAAPSAWPSVELVFVDEKEQQLNRQLFIEGRNRKKPAKSPAANGEQEERKAG